MKENYPKAYKEVLEILKFIPQEDVNKIPEDLIKTFEYKKDNDYNFVICENDDFGNLNILDETKAIFANIFRDYWATPSQREKIIAKQNYDKKELEEEKNKKYNPDECFKYNVDKNAKEKEEIVKQVNKNIHNKEKLLTKIFNDFKEFMTKFLSN